MKLPKIKDEIMVRREEDDFYVIDIEKGEIYRLNRTAAAIFESCRENLSLEELITRLSEGKEEELTLIKQDVLETIKKFRELRFTEN